MPGKLPGGKVRISSTPPSIISKTKNPSTSEVQYFGLVRDLYLEDLTSNADAIEQVLEDIQDPAERKAVGKMRSDDLAIIDGIVNFNIKKEDLSTLGGASLNDENNNALVNPRYRLSDRIKQFESFTGRGVNFTGSGPTKFTYIVPKQGDLLPGSVSISTSGVVTGTGTTFSDESSINEQLNRTLEPGDYVYLYEADGTTLHKVGATNAEKAQDSALYKVVTVTDNTQITLSPAPSFSVSGGKKLRKRYCHNVIPPFFSEAIDSTKFNAPEAIPAPELFRESHRFGYLLNGVFTPEKELESWWEGKYNTDFRSRAEYGDEGESSLTNPKFPIVKDGNLNFAESFELLPQRVNVGLKYDFFLKKGFNSSANLAKFRAQVNGHLRIDYYEQTGYDANGNAQGNWKTALDTTDPDTYFREIRRGESATDGRLGFREFFLQGGPDLKDVAEVEDQNPNNSINLNATYNNEEGTTTNTFRSNYVPVVVRYWYGQDTIDDSLENYQKLNSVRDPSFSLDIIDSDIDYDPADPTVGTNKYWNSFFGNYELTWNSTDSAWDIVNSSEPNYKTNSTDLAHSFAVLAWSNINASNAPEAVSESNKSLETYLTSLLDANLTNKPDSPGILGGTRVVVSGSPDTLSTTQLDITFDGLDTSTFNGGEKIYVVLENNPNIITPKDPLNVGSAPSFDSGPIWSVNTFNPDLNGSYTGTADMLSGGPNFVEPNPKRVEYEENPEYFKYKFGIKPTLNTYGVARYDGFIKNRINGTSDTDYTHSKVLTIGRQKKASTGTTDEYTGSTLANGAKPLADTDGDTIEDEVRNRGELYTFISVEEDEAGNGGNVTINAYPTNTLASIFNTAGEDNGGKLLHSSDNTETYGNPLRQNNSNIQTNLQLPLSSNFDDTGNFTGPSYSMKYVNINSGAKLIFYPAKYTANTISPEEYDPTTRGMISTSGLGILDVGAGTNGRTKANKSAYLYKFDKFKYEAANGTAAAGSETRYFIDFLLATRPNADASVTPVADSGNNPDMGVITSSVLFGNFGIANNTELARVYDGTLIEFYKDSNALNNSGNQVTGEDSPVAMAYVIGYDYTTESATYELINGTYTVGNEPTLNIAHSVRLYYNHFEITKVPAKLTTESGSIETGGEGSLSGSADSSTMRLWFVYNAGIGFARADNGQGLSFAETLYVNPNSANQINPQVFPFAANSELPSPPSATVTPFDFDNSPTTPGNPGLGGLCYPPYQTQEVSLKSTVTNDLELYAADTGNYDVYFGSPQVSSTNLGNKYLQVNDEFSFDFDEGDRPNIIPEGTDLTTLVPNFPVFNAGAYTHKLKVNLSPYIGSPSANTGLFARSAYNGLANDNIFKDCLIFSNEKPVKEIFYLFAKKSGGETEGPISILIANNPENYT